MRALADAERLRHFLRELSREAREDTAVYLTGGATAVLLGWRESTVDAEPQRLRELFATIVPQLHRYPAIDPPSFGRRLEEALAGR